MTVEFIKEIINELKGMYLEKAEELPESISFWTTSEDEELIAAIKVEVLEELERSIENNEKFHQHLNACVEGREKL